MQTVIKHLKRMWNIFIAAREAAAISHVEKYLSTQSMSELERRQKELMFRDFDSPIRGDSCSS